MVTSRLCAAAILTTLCAIRPAHADPREDFVFEIKEAGHETTRAWVVDKYVTFKVGAKCLAKLADKNNGAVRAGLAFAQSITHWAKDLTGDDWQHIESQNSHHEDNIKLVEPMMTEFGKRFALTIQIEGDDCDARMAAPWLKYWTSIGSALEKHPPKADKVTVTLDVRAKQKALTVESAKDGATFKIIAPRDIEGVWSDNLEKAFTKVARAPKN
jgi:hypothetical protein